MPGGTGYLKQLSQKPEIFLQVLRLALEHLKSCQCATRADHDTYEHAHESPLVMLVVLAALGLGSLGAGIAFQQTHRRIAR